MRQPTNKRKKTITIHDLAKELNVSASTVSRALKEHPSISTETTNTVKKLAIKRGYRPNQLAASLRKSQTTNIGILIPWINRPFISSLISGAEKEARDNGFNIIISQSQDSYENEAANLKALYDSQVCGLITSLAMETQDFEHFGPFIDNETPLIFVDRVPENMDCHRVTIDNFTSGFKATTHLIEQGCQRIAHLGGALHKNIYRERQRGYLAALQQHHLPIDDSLIVTGRTLSAEEGIKLAEHLLALPEPPDGIFAANDSAAVSVIQYAKSIGISIPDQLAIIGFNDDPICKIIEPQLSSVIHPAAEMGKISVQQALKLIKNNNKEIINTQTIVLETDLVIRKSSLKKT